MSETKVCKICQVEKPLACFHPNKFGIYGVDNRCKSCRSLIAKEKYNPIRKINEQKKKDALEKVINSKEKICLTCGVNKPITDYYRSKKVIGGYRNTCKACVNEMRKMLITEDTKKKRNEKNRLQYKNMDNERKDKRLQQTRERHRKVQDNPITHQRELDRVREYRKNNVRDELWRRAKTRAKDKGVEFSIDKEDIIVPIECPILGVLLIVNDGKNGNNSPSLDRIDSSKGYVKGNVQVISWRANNLKKDATLEELRKIVEHMEKITS